MKLPKHAADIAPRHQAKAPYNFVELPEAVATQDVVTLPDQDVFHAERHSGWLDCVLTTASPVYVRAGAQPDDQREAKDLPDFFHINDARQPVIPGSTLRGMLRALVEIAGYSRVSQVNPASLVYRSIEKDNAHSLAYRDRLMRDDGAKHYTPLMRGGYLRRAGSDWHIQPAQEIGGTTFARIKLDDHWFNQLPRVPNCKNAHEIYVKVGPYEYQPVLGGFLHIRAARVQDSSREFKPGYLKATLARSGGMFSKRSEAVIYPPDEKAQQLELTDRHLEAYRDQVTPKQESHLGKQGALNEGQPVFYTLDSKGAVDFFGHCRMLRLPYKKSPRELVPAEIRARETDEEWEYGATLKADLAESLFGYTRAVLEDAQDKPRPGADEQEKAAIKKRAAKRQRYAGRVSVGDARLLPGQREIWLSSGPPLVPHILGTPKPTAFQQYLVQPKAGEMELKDYDASTYIRGHKLYWHKNAVTFADLERKATADEKSKENVTTKIRPLAVGVRFSFRARFDNLSPEELGALLWVLDKAADDKYRLKVGMGKPLGMGAVKIEATLRLVDRKQRYGGLFQGPDGWAEGLTEQSRAEQARRDAIADFEDFVLCALDAPEEIESLDQLERIKQLLALLSWPGPPPHRTRYLEITRPDSTAPRGKINEYKGRPVLPGPLALTAPLAVLPLPEPVKSEKPASVLPSGFKRGTIEAFGLGPKASYGFIKPDGGGAKVFVHKNVFPPGSPRPAVGQRVIYRERRGPRGMEAAEARFAS